MAYANRLINKLFLYKYHFRTANRFAAILSYFYIIRAVSYIVLIKGKLVTVIALRHICHFETADAALLIQLYRKQIKNMLDIANAVHMSVNINIAISGLVFREEAGSVEVTFIRDGFSMGQGSSHT